MTLYPIDREMALKRIEQLDAKPFLTSFEQQDYQNRIAIVEEYDRQFRNNWKSERRAWIKSLLNKMWITPEQAEAKLAQIDNDADAIIGQPNSAWRA